MPGTRKLIVLPGEMGHKNLWLIDGDSRAERQLSHFAPDFTVRDFDSSPDGTLSSNSCRNIPTS